MSVRSQSKDSFFLVFFIFSAIALLLFGLSATLLPGDPAIYIYDGLLAHKGFMPYRDFFLAHPPLRIWIANLIFKLGGTPDWFPWVSLISSVMAVGAVGWIVFRLKGLPWAFLAMFLYMFSTLELTFCTYYVGTNISQLFLAFGLLFLFEEFPVVSGVLSSIALMQGLYTIPFILGLMILARAKAVFKRYLAGFALVIPLLATAWWVYGMPFIQQVFIYHFRKISVVSGYHWGTLFKFIFGDILLITAPLGILLKSIKDHRLTLSFYLFIASLIAVFMIAIYKDLNLYYFTVVLPLLVPAAAVGASDFVEWMANIVGSRVAVVVISVAILILTYLPHLFYTVDLVRTQAMAQEEKTALLNMASRIIGPDKYVTGDSSIAPFLAVQLGMKIPDNLVDTNHKRLKTNILLKNKLLYIVKTHAKLAVVAVPDHGIMLDNDINTLIHRHFKPVLRFVGKALHYDIYFYKRR